MSCPESCSATLSSRTQLVLPDLGNWLASLERLEGDGTANIQLPDLGSARRRVLEERQERLTTLKREDQGEELCAGGRQGERTREGRDERPADAELKGTENSLRRLICREHP